VAKLPLFDRDLEKMADFVMIYRLYIRMRIGEKLVNLNLGDWKFLSAGELLAVLRREFGRRNDKSTKVVELKQLIQDSCTMDKFV